jgi:hypothetical protein
VCQGSINIKLEIQVGLRVVRGYKKGKNMPSITLNTHFDGQQITLDEPFEIPSNAKLLVTVLETPDLERDEWTGFSVRNLPRAYSDDEPEYPVSALKEVNPEYAQS